MKLGPLSVDRHFLESRVARRVFATVALCAFLPVATFAGFAYHAVGVQLEGDASRALRVACKAAGMGILERLLLADEVFRQQLAGAAPEAPADANSAAGRALRGLARLGAERELLRSLEPRQRSQLLRGAPALVVRAEGDAVRLFLLRRSESRGVWRAEVDPGFVFSGERRFAGRGYWVADARGALLFASPEERGSLPRGEGSDEQGGRTYHAKVAGQPSLVADWPLFLASVFAADSWTVHVSRPLADVYAPLSEFEAIFPWVVGITLCCALGLSLAQIRRTLVPVSALTRGARRVAVGDFSARVDISFRDEFGVLSQAFNEMAEVIERQIDVMATVNRIGAALSAQDDTDILLDLILQGALQVTRADGGALLLTSNEGDLELRRVRLQHSVPVAHGRPEDHFPREVARRCLERRHPLRVDELAVTDARELDRWREFGLHLGAPVASWLGLPMRDERGEALGVLLLVSRSRDTFDDSACQLAESLASQAAVAMRKNRLVESFRALFEGVIQLTVKAIDEKSPYTGDHCRKVPVLTELIADALCQAREGPFKDFDLSPDERYELRIAALLHDCGKVVTPVHVMDKGTKLEAIFDRIELVSTRFELLRRDAQLRALERRSGASAEEVLRGDEELARELASIEEDLSFLRRCNIGTEGMPEAERERVRQIAARHHWTTAAGEERSGLDEDEVTNLQVRRGTLTEAEREIINGHVVTTISLLEELPFPRNMRRVPAIAGAHHEHVDGSGYPLQLHGEQLDMQARILGLADVFEALTAPDRPYKLGRTLSETLETLGTLCEAGHIDRDLYAFFLSEKLYLRYAAEHLAPEQIDAAHQPELERLTGP